MTAAEVYDLTTHGGASDFAQVIAVCESSGPYCLIGGLAVNSYVEAVYTLDADLVVSTSSLEPLTARLRELGFKVELHEHSVNVRAAKSEIRIQFTTDDRYQPFLSRSVEAEVLGIRLKVACLEDVTQGKLWAYSDPRWRLIKRKKDELDLIRLAEAHPELRRIYPKELQEQLEGG